MRLLRLTTENPNAVFDTNFNDNIIIKPNASIAVRNVSAELDSEEVTINAYNNELTYQISAGGSRTIRIPTGTYDRNTFDELLEDIQFALNQSSNYQTPFSSNFYLGIEWNIGTIEANKKKIGIHFENAIHGLNLPELNLALTIDITAGPPNNRKISTQVGVVNTPTYEHNILAMSRISQGNGYIRARIDELIENVPASAQGLKHQGVLIGLSTFDITTLSSDEFIEDMISYGLGLSFNAASQAVYYSQVGAVVTEDVVNSPNYIGPADLDNDFFEVMKNGNKIQLRRYKNGEAEPTVMTEFQLTNDNKDEQYYPFIVFHGAVPNIVLNSLRWTPSPFVDIPSNFVKGEETDDSNSTLNVKPPFNRKTPRTQLFIEFEDLSTATFLGYNSKRQPAIGLETTNDTGGFNFIAQNEFKPQVIIDSFMVELLNMPVQSYDSSQRQRKNLIATLIKSDNNDIIDFTLGDVFINLDNASPINLKNIRMRIVGTDYSTINIRGTAVITLLIDEP